MLKNQFTFNDNCDNIKKFCLSNETNQITVNGLKITIKFSEDRNKSVENSIGKLLLEKVFKGVNNG